MTRKVGIRFAQQQVTTVRSACRLVTECCAGGRIGLDEFNFASYNVNRTWPGERGQ
jgi:hypothetical protein